MPAAPSHARSLVFAAACLFTTLVMAQSSAGGSRTTGGVQKGSIATQESSMDTNETLSFMGKKLWFEVRRRLNLTTKEEEAEQKATEKQFKLKLGDIQLSGTAPAPAPDP